jgi:hypothetical protein
MDDLEYGVQATLIDLGLSRMDAGDGSDEGEDVQWTPFEDEVFMGEGDYQFDVYRLMNWCTGGNWKGYYPLTNVMVPHTPCSTTHASFLTRFFFAPAVVTLSRHETPSTQKYQSAYGTAQTPPVNYHKEHYPNRPDTYSA